MKTPRPPIFIDEHGDIRAFGSVAEAAADLEAIDVLNGEYEAFDSNGQPLVLRAERWSDPVSITMNAEDLPRPDELARRLRSYVERVGPDRVGLVGPVEAAPLRRLVLAVADFHAG